MNKLLTAEDPESEEFEFRGDCYICAKGSGQISILRQMGGSFEVITDDTGEPFTRIGDGVIFNGVVTCNSKIKHKVVASTTSEILLSIVKER